MEVEHSPNVSGEALDTIPNRVLKKVYNDAPQAMYSPDMLGEILVIALDIDTMAYSF